MRVQFTVDDNQWNKLQELAIKAGYPDVSSYCRGVSLKERTYAEMWTTVQKKISKMKPGEMFSLNELVEVPPSNLGVKLYEHRKELKIEKIGKINGSNKFKKL